MKLLQKKVSGTHHDYTSTHPATVYKALEDKFATPITVLNSIKYDNQERGSLNILAKILKGGTNTTAIKYAVHPTGSDDTIYEFVEKICPKYKHREALALSAYHDAGDIDSVTPYFIGCSLLADGSLSVLMEFLPGARYLSQADMLNNPEIIFQVGRSVARISTQVDLKTFRKLGLEKGHLPKVEDLEKLYCNAVNLGMSQDDKSLSKLILSCCNNLDAITSLPLVPCSNDASLSNMSYNPKDGGKIKFFDLEKAGIGPIRSDLWCMLNLMYTECKSYNPFGHKSALLSASYLSGVNKLFPNIELHDVLIGANVAGLLESLKALGKALKAGDKKASKHRHNGVFILPMHYTL